MKFGNIKTDGCAMFLKKAFFILDYGDIKIGNSNKQVAEE